MKNFKHYALLLFAAVAVFGCAEDYDDTELRGDVNDLKSRVEKLETWCNTANSQISALQGLVAALEAKDYVTGVSPIVEGAKEVGYIITFSKSGAISIYNGKDGAKGTDGASPVIGVAKDTDGFYYWTVRIGDADIAWMRDTDGNKIRTTGEDGKDGVDGQPGSEGVDGKDGQTPVLSVATDTDSKVYWKVNGEWLLNNGQKVQATGDKGETGSNGAQGVQGDAVFASNGVEVFDDYVKFTLAGTDGTTFTLPKTNGITIGFENYDVFYCSPTDNQITLVLPATLKETDYNAITATVSNSNGTNMDIQTRSAGTANNWGVKIIKPVFSEGNIVEGSAKVILALPQNRTNYQAVLRVTIIDSKGKESSVSRIVWFKADNDANVIDNNSGTLSGKITNPTNVKQLSVIGSISSDDFKYMRENLTSLEVLDLSRATITALPERAMAFYGTMGLTDNTSLKTVILPETLNTIGNSAFAMCTNLEEINIPANVRTLGRWMFEGCNQLAEVTLPGGITDIPASAFYGCGIESINIPSSVNSIGAWAFSECRKLESANIPSGVTVLDEGLFAYCDNFQNISWHDNITSIGNDVFCVCTKFANKNLTLPAKVISIGARAFSFTGVTSVKLPQGLQSIANSAFNQCPITTIELPSSITSLHAISFLWSAATTVICNSTTPPAMPNLDDNDNSFPLFYQISSSCVLKRPAGADYSDWSTYFKGGIQDL